jgi:glutaredoxin
MAASFFSNRREPKRAVIYHRPACHLCDEAGQLLIQHGYELVWVNIDEDADLRAKFDTCVPVVEIDGKIRFRGKIDPLLLRRLD